MTLGDVIRAYRDKHSMSMDVFSKNSGISKTYISLLEKNKHPKTGKPISPSVQCIKQAADAMHMDFDDLFNMIDCNVSLQVSTKSEPLVFHPIPNHSDGLSSHLQAYYDYFLFLSKNPEYEPLFKATKKLRPDDIDLVCKILERFNDDKK